MTINFSFFSLFFVLMIRPLGATTHAIDDLPNWSTTYHVRIILKRGHLLVQGLFTSFLSKENVWLKSVPFMSIRKGILIQKVTDIISVSKGGLWLEKFSRNRQFSINVPQASIKVISEYHDFGTCIFGHWKSLASLKL